MRLSVQGETSQSRGGGGGSGSGGVQKDTVQQRGAISSRYLFKETIWTGQTIPGNLKAPQILESDTFVIPKPEC